MKKLSVIIVNYNVCHFLEQCLLSVREACNSLDSEVIVVDNNSVDGSVSMVRQKFPEVKLIANRQNVGFSRANNQAIAESRGEFILLLNPDTVVESDTFTRSVAFMDQTPDAGGLGVYMVDGKGHYLPESKRSLPTPAVAFYKIFGLSTLFPNSKKFGKYHLGYLDKHTIHEVDVLSGAYMMLRRKTLDIVGLLDETFFMYGEDIDLSYRITQAGFRNYYFPQARIIHYKGESTRKSSVNYVFTFYQAMIIFARKHFSGKNARLFSMIIHMAIWFRAGIALAKRTMARIIFPLTDIILLWTGMFLLKEYWASYVRFGIGSDYPPTFMYYVVPAYIGVWLLSIFFSGGYDKPVVAGRLWRGMGIGTLIILVVYALLPETLRFSRALIILGFFWASLALPLYRYLLNIAGFNIIRSASGKQRRFAIIGSSPEAERVTALLRKTHPDAGFIGVIEPHQKPLPEGALGHLNQISEIVAVYHIQELIFCLKDIEAKEIINLMTSGIQGNPDYKIAPPESMFLVGSGAIHSPYDLYLLDFNTIVSAANRRNKRIFDLLASFILMLFAPVFIPFQRTPGGYFRNVLKVIGGRKSWIGYESNEHSTSPEKLPPIRHGILHPADGLKIPIVDDAILHSLNFSYARDYRLMTDVRILLSNLRNLGRMDSSR